LGVCGLGPNIKIDPTQPLTSPCLLDIAHKDKKWSKDGSKWQCKVDNCIIAYDVTWLLTKHLKKVHGLMAEKAKRRRPSTSKGVQAR